MQDILEAIKIKRKKNNSGNGKKICVPFWYFQIVADVSVFLAFFTVISKNLSHFLFFSHDLAFFFVIFSIKYFTCAYVLVTNRTRLLAIRLQIRRNIRLSCSFFHVETNIKKIFFEIWLFSSFFKKLYKSYNQTWNNTNFVPSKINTSFINSPKDIQTPRDTTQPLKVLS